MLPLLVFEVPRWSTFAKQWYLSWNHGHLLNDLLSVDYYYDKKSYSWKYIWKKSNQKDHGPSRGDWNQHPQDILGEHHKLGDGSGGIVMPTVG